MLMQEMEDKSMKIILKQLEMVCPLGPFIVTLLDRNYLDLVFDTSDLEIKVCWILCDVTDGDG